MINEIIILAGLGGYEIIFIAVIVLILFGGKKLPELMKGLGKGIKEFKDITNSTKESIKKEINDNEVVSAVKDATDTVVGELRNSKSQKNK